MNIDKKTTEKITWDIDLCKAEGEITMENGKILDQTIRIFKDCPEPGDSPGNAFTSNDPQFIRDVHRALRDYIQHLDGIMRGCSQDDRHVSSVMQKILDPNPFISGDADHPEVDDPYHLLGGVTPKNPSPEPKDEKGNIL